MARIDDGTGQGFSAQVFSTNRLAVSAEVIPSIAIASLQFESAFVANTGTSPLAVNVAGAAPNGYGVLYLQNTSPRPLSIGGLAASTDNAGTFRLWRNPTTGTLISAGTLLSPVQLRFDSNTPFGGVQRIAAAANQTITNGTVLALGRVGVGYTELQLQGAAILGTSDSVAVTFEPAAADSLVTLNIICAYINI